MIPSSDKQSFPILLLLVFTFSLMLLLANLLLIAKTEQALKTTVQDTVLTATTSLQSSLTESYTLGIYPETIVTQERLKTIAQSAERIQGVGWYNNAGVLFNASANFNPTKQLTNRQLGMLRSGSQTLELDNQQSQTIIALSIKNTFGQSIGFLAVAYSTEEVIQLRHLLIDESLKLAPYLMGTGIVVFCLLFIIRRVSGRQVSHYLSLTLLSTLGMAVLAVFMFKQAEPLIQPFLTERLDSIAKSQEQLWTKAYQLNFNLNDFEPLNDYLTGLTKDYREIGSAQVLQVQQTNGPAIQVDTKHFIQLEPNSNFLKDIQFELGLDYLTLALILFFFWSQFKKETIKGLTPVRSQQIAQLKPLLFLFFLSEEFIRPILPAYAASKELFGLAWLNTQWIPSLSISVFMLIVALSQLFLGRINAFNQAKRYWLFGATTVAVGQTLLMLAPWAEVLLIARVLAGFGYACCFVASQCMLLIAFGQQQKVSAFASLVVCIMAATVVGPAFGGLVTDYFGQQATIALAIVCPLIAVIWAVRLNQNDSELRHTQEQHTETKQKHFLSGLTQPALLSISLLAAVPAKMILTGLLFFLLPLMVIENGLSAADVGRIILIYGFLMLFCVPPFARLSQKLGSHHSKSFVACGLLISSLCAILPLLCVLEILPPLSPFTLAAPIALALGLGQAVSISSQPALVQTLQATHAPQLPPFAWLGTYRFIERLGNAMGPPVAAVLLLWFDVEHTLMAFGGMAALCAFIIYFWLGWHTQKSKVVAT